ncbi:MAG: LuxR C-terminal-related transcriptional regulator [Chitinophagales bacterium]
MEYSVKTSNSVIESNGRDNTIYKHLSILSKRETEILAKVANGSTTREIANVLYISVNTVETHRRNIIKKMKAKNIVHAAVMAIRKGLIA